MYICIFKVPKAALYILPKLGWITFILFELQTYLILLYMALQTEGKTLHQQKAYNFLYCDTCFDAMVWKLNPQFLRYACISS